MCLISAFVAGIIGIGLAIEVSSTPNWCLGKERFADYVSEVKLISEGISVGGYINCSSDDTNEQAITLIIEGPADTWFGIIFEEEEKKKRRKRNIPKKKKKGQQREDAIIYTTGRLEVDSPQFYDYIVTHRSSHAYILKNKKKKKKKKCANRDGFVDVAKNIEQEWKLVGSTWTRNGVVGGTCRRQLSTVDITDGRQQSAKHSGEKKTLIGRYVVGRKGKMQLDEQNVDDSGHFEITFAAVMEQSSLGVNRNADANVRASSSGSNWCDGVSVYPANFSVPVNLLGNGISIGGTINCPSSAPENQTITLTIIGPSSKWFGIAFGSYCFFFVLFFKLIIPKKKITLKKKGDWFVFFF
ncbi:hypothetical protein RFI_19516 [Reticulomyxa filosa]|uniref:Uncharacterized protein n=1 Tax=Reticulomyxa filosa TaxID=46433 RepID=X6MWD5_RETFI|nr:hypothetical protein RFI_19516 [Reticulomyxa filosa]|eukprot:ETO17797.1 hypothetical protein RFI_19516 [Reticulomyxa filosa]